MNETKAHDPNKIEESSDAVLDASQEQDRPTSMIQRMVAQCGALLRQQLERKAKQEPGRYDQARVDRIMNQFEVSSPDIQATIVQRVESKISAYVQQEILRILEDVLNDEEDSIPEPVWSDGAYRLPSAVNEDVSRQPEEGRPAAEEDDTLLKPEMKAEEPHNGVSPELQRAAPSTTEMVQEQNGATEDHGIHPSSETDGTSEQPSQVSAEGVYEGTVELRVEAEEHVRQVIKFVDALRQKSDFRLLQLVGNYKEGVGIWLGLRSPLRLKEILLQMESVSQVDAPAWRDMDGSEPMLKVRLAEAPAPN